MVLNALASPVAADAGQAAHPMVRSGGGTALGLVGPRDLPKRVLPGRLRTDSGTYVFEFPGEKSGYVINAGLESSWVTGR